MTAAHGVTPSAPLLDRVAHGDEFDPDAFYDVFVDWAHERGLVLYPAQDEAIIELLSGANVILSTPTGTGKSLVAVAAHALSVARGGRTYYTAPIKALVSEKFFDLVETFGAERVGMVTGDSSINADAPIICCTAEILANIALRHGPEAPIDQIVMDEFHFYGDPERGWAWQVPLLLLVRAQFLLMSATLGDVTAIAEDLGRRTGRPTANVTGAERPVPLHFSYAVTPIHETVEDLLQAKHAPVYIVHFSQSAAMERAQALSSIRLITRGQRDEIAADIGGFRFTTAFGRTLSRLVRSGIGLHHAGMLPRYRRLVETLAQRGLLRVICGTDTLGVGINVPIRSVVLTALAKYDGQRMRQLTAREFHQIAGRAGRAGYDTAGTVVVQAPEHESENATAIARAGEDPKKLRKIVRKKPPPGSVTWTERSFERLVAAEPEVLTPQLKLTAAMLINIISRGGDVYANVRDLVFDNHESPARQYELARRAIGIFRTLVTAGVVDIIPGNTPADSPSIRLTVDLQPNFALNQPLSPFALAAIDILDPESPEYPLDVISIIESTLDDPRAILSQQQFRERGEAVAAMKDEGLDYDERMEALEAVTYPKPLDELLEHAFETFAVSQPWVRDLELRPKSVVRDMYERALSFGEYVAHYQVTRSEGLVLRYLSDAYRAIRQTVPEEAKSDSLRDIIAWLGEVVRQVDSSLVDEWEQLAHPAPDVDEQAEIVPPPPPSVLTNRRAFTVLVRNELFRRVQLAALDRHDELSALDPDVDWAAFLDAYFSEHDEIGTGMASRSASLLIIDDAGPQTADASDQGGRWRVEQIIDDPEGDHDWRLRGDVDLVASENLGTSVVRVTWAGRI